MARFSYFYVPILILASSYIISGAAACYTAVFGFGDSLTDAGNLIHLQTDGKVPRMYSYPYGETFFGHPTGRCSDGRLTLDFIAQHYGLDMPPPYLQWLEDLKKSVPDDDDDDNNNNFNNGNGMNFGVVGARAVDAQFYQQRGIYDKTTNVSMTDQLDWFLLQTLPSLCNSPSPDSCIKSVMEESLFVLGEFGGNDYYNVLRSEKSLDDITPFFTMVTQTIANGVLRLVEAGARTVIVPNLLPIGCAASYLTYNPSPKEEDYDQNGCLISGNEMVSYHNQLLQQQLNHLRDRHPHIRIVYADLFNAAMQIYADPVAYGFSEGALTACCGGGGPYNFNKDVLCGEEGANFCENPSLYVNWDGPHLTERAYSIITNALLDGPFTYPPMNASCRYPAKNMLVQL